MEKKGIFFVVEGTDGSGKDSVITELANMPIIAERNPVLAKDPSPKVAGDIRKLLLNTEMEEATKLFLFLAARNELLHKQILPALNNGNLVICNRYAMSTYAYQKFHKREVDAISSIGGLSIVPDLQVILLSWSSFRKTSEDLLDDYCNKHRAEIINRYTTYASDYPALNASIIWVDGKTVREIAREVLAKLLPILEPRSIDKNFAYI